MGIRFYCPNGHKMNVKEFQAGRRGICPQCGARMTIPTKSTRKSSKELRTERARSTGKGQTPGAASTADEPPPQVGDVDDGDGQVLELAAHDTSAGGVRSPAAAPDAPAPSAAEHHATAWERAAEADKPDESASAAAPEPGPASPAADSSQSAATPPAPNTAPPTTNTGPITEPSPAPDPLDESPTAVWYVRPPSGGQFGPAQADMMRHWLAEYRVSPDSLVWREGWPDWRTAAEVFPQLGPVTASGSSGRASGDSFIGSLGRLGQRPRRPRGRNRQTDARNQALIITALVITVLALGLVFALVVF